MRRCWGMGLILAALAACSAPPVDPASVPRFGQVVARFVAGHDDQVIEVSARDRVAIRRVVLIMPDGMAVPAYAVDTGRDAIDDPTPAPGTAVPGTPSPHAVPIGQIVSLALIRIPNMDDYAHGWKSARLAVDLGDHDGRHLILAAPAPL